MIEYLKSTDSTNNRLKARLANSEQPSDGYCLYTFYQTAGRGQSGNGWESENGKNLLFSILFYPNKIQANEQFRLSMFVAVVITNIVRRYISNNVRIKWPNDIYVADKKICGILIETQLLGSNIGWCVAGVGLNVNQTDFSLNIPNPVSIKVMTGIDTDLHLLIKEIVEEFKQQEHLLYEPNSLKEQYMNLLYRREGYYPYIEREVSLEPTMNAYKGDGEVFFARIIDIDDEGRIILERKDGRINTYHFKQIRYVI